MELKYGHKRANGITLLLSIPICIAAYISTHSDFLTIGALFISGWTFPGVLRFFFCSNWIETKASILEVAYLSKTKPDWRGNVTDLSQKRIRIQYSVDGKLYATDILPDPPVREENLSVYYNPRKPEDVCLNKGLGQEGILFMAFISFLTLCALWPDLFPLKIFR